MKRVDGIYVKVKKTIAKSETKRRLTFGTVALVILGLISAYFINFSNLKQTYASPGTRTKTVEFFVGQNVSTGGIASGTSATYDFTAYFPDAVSSPIRSAYVLYHTVISAADASATQFQLGLQGGSLTTLSSPAVIDQTGESQPAMMRLNATSVLQGIVTGSGNYNLRFTTSITGPVRYGELAKLIVTYDYNDAATTQIKTITAFIGQETATKAAGASSTFNLAALNLPENSVTVRSSWAETQAYTYQSSDAAYNLSFQWDSETAKNIAWTGTTNSYSIYALITPVNTFTPGSSHTFTVTNNSGGTLSGINAFLALTYEFNYSNSTELMNSLKILLYQGTETASTATLTGNKVINIPETSITGKSAFLLGRAVQTQTSARTLGMNAQLSSAPGSSTSINFNANAGETDGFATILADVTSNLSSLTNGDNTVYWRYDSSGSANIRGLTLYLNYKFAKSTTSVFNAQMEWFVGQQTAASATWSQAFTPAIADSNYTLKSSHLNAQFNTNATTATTYTVGITTTAAHAFLTTGENTMGEVWKDTSSDVTALGSSLTATLNGSNSTTKSASFLVWWRVETGYVTVSTTGSQTSTINIPSTNNYVGGAFTFVRNAGSANVTQIIVTETGTVNANANLSNLDLYYETAGTCSYDGNETLFGTATSFDASEKATVSGTMSVGTSQVCVYALVDVGSGASNGQTLDIEINASGDVTVSSGSVSGSFPVAISGSTTLQSTNQNPNSPSSLAQKKTDDTVITTGQWVGTTSIKYTATVSDPDGDQVRLCVEKDPLGTSFSGTEDLCGDLVASGSTASVTITDQTDATEYHWQARAKDANNTYSSWVSYGGNGENERDYGLDTTAPTGGSVYDGLSGDQDWNDGSLTQISANWTGFDASVSGLNKYEYAIRRKPDDYYWSVCSGSGSWQAGANWCDNGTSTSFTQNNLNLQTGVLYYVSVRATDNAGNTASPVNSNGQQVSPTLSFAYDANTITFSDLDNANGWTDTKTNTFTTSTNAYSGYVIKGYITQLLTSLAYPSVTIPNFYGTWNEPQPWPSGTYGFGYTSSDTLVQGSNRFNNGTKYAAFSQTSPGDVVADHTDEVNGSTGAVVNEQFTITYKLAVSQSQAASTYRTWAIYVVTANY